VAAERDHSHDRTRARLPGPIENDHVATPRRMPAEIKHVGHESLARPHRRRHAGGRDPVETWAAQEWICRVREGGLPQKKSDGDRRIKLPAIEPSGHVGLDLASRGAGIDEGREVNTEQRGDRGSEYPEARQNARQAKPDPDTRQHVKSDENEPAVPAAGIELTESGHDQREDGGGKPRPPQRLPLVYRRALRGLLSSSLRCLLLRPLRGLLPGTLLRLLLSPLCRLLPGALLRLLLGPLRRLLLGALLRLLLGPLRRLLLGALLRLLLSPLRRLLLGALLRLLLSLLLGVLLRLLLRLLLSLLPCLLFGTLL